VVHLCPKGFKSSAFVKIVKYSPQLDIKLSQHFFKKKKYWNESNGSIHQIQSLDERTKFCINRNFPKKKVWQASTQSNIAYLYFAFKKVSKISLQRSLKKEYYVQIWFGKFCYKNPFLGIMNENMIQIWFSINPQPQN